jgi:hypothetical protein
MSKCLYSNNQVLKGLLSVIPAKAGIQYSQAILKPLDPVFQRGDDFSSSIFGFSYGNSVAIVYWPLLGFFLIPLVSLVVLIAQFPQRKKYFIFRVHGGK